MSPHIEIFMEFPHKVDKSNKVGQSIGLSHHALQEGADRSDYFASKVKGPNEGLEVAKAVAGFGLPGGDERTEPSQFVIGELSIHFSGIQENTLEFQLSRGGKVLGISSFVNKVSWYIGTGRGQGNKKSHLICAELLRCYACGG